MAAGLTIQRFFAKIAVTPAPEGITSGPCWIWTATKNRKGYGMFRANRYGSAHRYAYRTLIGPIPLGLHIDHLCRNRDCVNPMHMEPVTNAENQRRGKVNQYKSLEACKYGHEFDEANTYYLERKDRQGRITRKCRKCAAQREAKRREAKQKEQIN
jgi:hypothetical protein